MGIQSGIIYGQVILGGAITTFALGIFGNTVYFIVLTVIGTLSYLFVHFCLDDLMDVEEPVIEEKQEKKKFLTELLKVLQFYPAMKLLVPAMILDGILLGFTTTNFSNLLKE